MEEIVSTEPLEKEILSDARKKAERILKDADGEVVRIGDEGVERTKKALEDLCAHYESRARRYRDESMARLPLEKARIKAAHIDGLLVEAVDSYLSALKPEERDRILAALLSRAAPLVGDAGLRVRYCGIGRSEAEGLVKKGLPHCAVSSLEEDKGIGSAGIAAVTDDQNLTVRATLDLVAERLLDEKRGELAKTLCGEALNL